MTLIERIKSVLSPNPNGQTAYERLNDNPYLLTSIVLFSVLIFAMVDDLADTRFSCRWRVITKGILLIAVGGIISVLAESLIGLAIPSIFGAPLLLVGLLGSEEACQFLLNKMKAIEFGNW